MGTPTNRDDKSRAHLTGKSKWEDDVSSGDACRDGNYSVVRELVVALNRIIPPNGGELIKREVDEAIDACGDFQNLREIIWDMKVKHDKIREGQMEDYAHEGQSAQDFFLTRGLDFLERYWFLIAFNAYLHDQAPKRCVAARHIRQRVLREFA